MRYRQGMVIVMALAAWLAGSLPLQAAPLSTQTHIALQLDALASFPDATVAGQTVHALLLDATFYAQRKFRPAWSNDKGPLAQADALVTALAAADKEGLRPADYHLAAIRTLLATLRKPAKEGAAADAAAPNEVAARLDLLLTDAFITYGSHLAKGRVDPEQIFPNWQLYPADVDPVQLLRKALAENHIAEALRGLLPARNGYFHLHEALAHYREIEASGGWPTIPDGPKLILGAEGARVSVLRHRLKISGDLAAADSGGDAFDAALEAAVRHYQRRMGLLEDGIVGGRTLREMNVPVTRRIRQIIINMERLRWLPRDLGQRYVQVNVAAFALKVVEDDKPVLTMRAIVGKLFHSTPVFAKKMEYLVINPAWNVPRALFFRELLPRLRSDPKLLSRKHIRILSEWGSNGHEIDPASIDWAKTTEANFPYYLRQDPGPFNELGVLKFMFPNKYSVYLHDTPHKYLFDASVRNFSHGCVRIAQPLALADYLLKEDPDWDEAKIKKAIANGAEQIVVLKRQVPVYFLYLTAWADGAGLHFRNDIYHRDALLTAALL